jgi:DNA-directed RNA polymerase sigma subunit (sigma70/sigma32)
MTGRLSVEAARLVEALDVLPEDIWTSEELYPFEVRFEDIGINELRAREVFRRERILPPDEQCERSALTRLVGDVLQTLTYREGLALSMKFGLEGEDTVTQAAVGKALGCSADNVRIIEMRALRKLRHPTRSDCLRTFIPDDWSYA